MKCIITSSVIFFLSISSSYSQIEDILKKIPGVGDVFEEAVTTSIKDAYPTAYWLSELDKQVKLTAGKKFSPNIEAGYYKFRFNTFCLHAGTYSPTEGAGYLVAPLKGSKADLIKNILTRYSEHPEIDQKDVQMLIWGIEAGQKFSSYPPDFQIRIKPLLSIEEIAKMEVDIKEIAYELLPQEVKDILNLYSTLRAKLSDPLATYEQIEQIAVLTGIPPLGKGSRNIEAGTWTSIGDGAYVRCFPEGYRKSNVEVYIPADVKIQKDIGGRIVSLDDDSYKIELQYEPAASNFKSAVIKNILTNEETTVENSLTDADYKTFKNKTEEFIGLVKKSFGKKKSKRLEGESGKTLEQLKNIELSLSSLIEKGGWLKDAYGVSVNALNRFAAGLETGNKKGGSNSSPHKISGLSDINGMVFAPANTSQQRLGNGENEGGNNENQNENQNQEQEHQNQEKEKEKKKCDVSALIHQVDESELPGPDWVYNVSVDIFIEGDDEECKAEEIQFTLFDVSKERGRCLNDMEKYDDLDEDLQMSDLNQGYELTKLTAKKQISGKSQTQQISILCRDYGASGKLKASVKVKGQWYEADGNGVPDKFITIPLDFDNNKIADFWEKQNNVKGKPAEWDEDPNPSGQARNGDGMTNYEEYRGFFVADPSGGKEHVRTDPMKKELFVIDDDQIFSITSWKAASDIKAYWLTKNLVYGDKAGSDLRQYRWVNFCSGYASGTKYAIRLIKVDGMIDPYGKHADLGVLGYNDPGYGPPKMANRTVMFPDRIRNWLLNSADSLENTLKKFPTGFMVDGVYYSKKEVQHFINEIRTPSKLDILVDFWLNLCVLHEVGHACDAHHHGGGDPLKTETGDPKCPMKYRSEYTFVKLDKTLFGIMDVIEKQGITPITIYTGWKFCKSKDNCWKQLDVNDR